MIATQCMLPSGSEVDLFFDIEVDPPRDFTYLHGIFERRGNNTAAERFIALFTFREDETQKSHPTVFVEPVAYLANEPEATIS